MKINHSQPNQLRKGAFMVLAFFCLVVCTSFVAFSVDLGYLNVSKVEMQNCVDASALAAAQEISAAVQNAPAGTTDITAYAMEQARIHAKDVAQLNGYYIDKDNDVIFGRRSYNAATDDFEITWNVAPANVVKVTARRDNDDLTAADSKLKLFFAGVAGDGYAKVKTEAIAFVESRDIVVVHDFSRSMNFDSYFNDEADDHLTNAQIESNMELVYDDLAVNDGSMVFAPRYLQVSDSDSGVDATVIFRYDEVDVIATEDIDEVKLEFDGGDQQTFSGSGPTGIFAGTGSRDGGDITKVWVTCTIEDTSGSGGTGGGGGSAVTLTGVAPTSKRQPQIHVTFSANRKSVTTVSSKDLSNVVLEFCDGTHYKFDGLSGKSRTFSGIGSNTDKLIKTVWVKSGRNFSGDGPGYGERFNNPTAIDDCSGGGTSTQEVTLTFEDTNQAVLEMFGLDQINYPYASGSWNGMVDHGRYHNSLTAVGYREMYGGLTLVNYILRYHSGYGQCDQIWKTRHYPFHAIKEGHELFCEFLAELGFDDELGMVSYDTHHRVETSLSSSDSNIAAADVVDISSEPISNNYTALNNLMKYKQANHYYSSTNMGGGLKRGTELLNAHRRMGSRATILLMTDGNTNTIDSGEDTSLPSGWDWDALLDYDGDGSGDYYTSSNQKRYCLRKAYEARQLDYTVHTMAVGIDADHELMKAIAHLTNGHFVNVPGGSSVSDMEAEVRAAFHKIASFVPPAKLMNDN